MLSMSNREKAEAEVDRLRAHLKRIGKKGEYNNNVNE
jgi:hypothetical protein